MSERIKENLNQGRDSVYDYKKLMRKLTNEYIDQFTTVTDLRKPSELFARRPKCCQKVERNLNGENESINKRLDSKAV